MKVDLAGFSRNLTSSFEAASESQGLFAFERIHMAGRSLRLNFLTEAMRDALMPSLMHLRSESMSNPTDDLILNIWESGVDGFFPPPWPFDNSEPRSDLIWPFDGSFAAALSHESGAFSFFDAKISTGIFWIRDARHLRGYEKAAPLLHLLHWYFMNIGLHITHAAVVGNATSAALLTGKGGSGKSTSAALALNGGLLHLADDYCLLSVDTPRAHAFYRSIKLHPRSLGLPPLISWRDSSSWSSEEKEVLLVDRDIPDETPLRLIIMPKVVGNGATRSFPATSAEALRSLAPSSLFQLRGNEAGNFSFYAMLAKTLPSYHLELGADPENVAPCIRDLLEKHAL